MPDIGVPPASALPVYRTLNLQKGGRKVLGPNLNCPESDRVEDAPADQRIARQELLHCGISILPLSALGHSRHFRRPGVSGSPQKRTFG
jgi:hypothetical protein